MVIAYPAQVPAVDLSPVVLIPVRDADLTDREVDVLRLLAAGRSNRAIAQALSVSEATVHTHSVNIYAKTGLHTRAGVALFAVEHDLLPVAKINRTVEAGSASSS